MRYLGLEYITPELRQGSGRHPGYNDIGTAVMAGASLLGSSMSADAASDAASTQAASADRSAMLQKQMFDQTRADLEPWRAAGGVALDKIMSLLGLAPSAGGSSFSAGQNISVPNTWQPGQTQDPLWEKLLAEFNATHQANFGIPMNRDWGSDAGAQTEKARLDEKYRNAKLAEMGTTAPADQPGDFGSLLKDFSLGDLSADPIFALTKDFQLSEVNDMLTKAASARGETDSGVLLKDLLKYGTNVLNTMGGDAYNRYNNNRSMKYNFLAPVANLGQTTGVQLGQMGQNTAANMGNMITGGANAQAAGIVGGANAMSQGIGGAIGAYQNAELLRRFGGSSYNGTGVPAQQAPAPAYDAQPTWRAPAE